VKDIERENREDPIADDMISSTKLTRIDFEWIRYHLFLLKTEFLRVMGVGAKADSWKSLFYTRVSCFCALAFRYLGWINIILSNLSVFLSCLIAVLSNGFNWSTWAAVLQFLMNMHVLNVRFKYKLKVFFVCFYILLMLQCGWFILLSFFHF